MPFALPDRYRERPVHQVANVRENLPRRAHAFGGMKLGKSLRRIADGFASAISQRGQRVTQQFAFRI